MMFTNLHFPFSILLPLTVIFLVVVNSMNRIYVLCLTVIVSKSIGCLLPMLVKKINQDPAVVAAPLITTVIDLCSIVIYFTIATSLLENISG